MPPRQEDYRKAIKLQETHLPAFHLTLKYHTKEIIEDKSRKEDHQETKGKFLTLELIINKLKVRNLH